MAVPKLTKLELQIMETLWDKGPCTIRELQEALPGRGRELPRAAYTTVQTVVYRLEWKRAIRRTNAKISNAHVFEAAISRHAVRRRMIDDLLGFFGGNALPVLAHLIDSGKLTEDELREAQKAFRARTGKENP